MGLLHNIDVFAFPSGSNYTPRMPMDALLVDKQVVLNDLNFNEIYKPYAYSVPVSKFLDYAPYGDNDNTRLISSVNNVQSYGIVDVESFSKALIEVLEGNLQDGISKGLFTGKQFRESFQQIFLRL